VNPYEWLTVCVSACALLAVIVSIWFLRGQVKVMSEQTKQLRQSLEMSAESAIDELFMVVTQAYLAHPELRPIFNEREAVAAHAVLDEETRHRASALAETLLDAIDRALYFRARNLPGSALSLQAWTLDSLRYSAFLRAWLADRRSWYSPEMSAMLERVESELQCDSGTK
jgi:Tfp pilus assembly protein PilN